ncbi:MAG: glycosyltransferase [Bryobacteraceae bacterium]
MSACTNTWALITGEYPPRDGGVADYTRLVARGLAARGDRVHVWAPACAMPAPADDGVEVHSLSDGFSPASLRQLSGAFTGLPSSTRVLVQYVPHAFGWKAMNIPFCLWLSSLRRPLWVMFHEVAVPWNLRLPRTNVIAAVTKAMARTLAFTAERCFVSIPAWQKMIGRTATWLPIPSSLPSQVDPDAAAAVRRSLGAVGETQIIGHFGTFGHYVAPILRSTLPKLLGDPRRFALLTGRGSREFAAELLDLHPGLCGRVHAAGVVPAEVAAVNLAACDVVLQPFPDGATTRRTSLMASVALGRPVVTNSGPLTEPLWRESRAVAMAGKPDPIELAEWVERLLDDDDIRKGIGSRAAALYRREFALDRTLGVLRG